MIDKEYFSESIEIPYFLVGYVGCDKFPLNFYELRNLMLRVSMGLVKPKGLSVYDIQAEVGTMFASESGDVIEGNMENNLPSFIKYHSFTVSRMKEIRKNRIAYMENPDEYVADSATNFHKNSKYSMDVLLFKESDNFFTKDLLSENVSKVDDLQKGDLMNLQGMYFLCKDTVSNDDLSKLISQGCVLCEHKRFDDYLKHDLIFVPQHTDLITLINY